MPRNKQGAAVQEQKRRERQARRMRAELEQQKQQQQKAPALAKRPTQKVQWALGYVRAEAMRRTAITRYVARYSEMYERTATVSAEFLARVQGLPPPQDSLSEALAAVGQEEEAWLMEDVQEGGPERMLRLHQLERAVACAERERDIITDRTRDPDLATWLQWLSPERLAQNPRFQENFVLFPFLIPDPVNFVAGLNWCLYTMDLECGYVESAFSRGDFQVASGMLHTFQMDHERGGDPLNSNLACALVWVAKSQLCIRLPLSHALFRSKRTFAVVTDMDDCECAICLERPPATSQMCVRCTAKVCPECLKPWMRRPEHRTRGQAPCPSCRLKDAFVFCPSCCEPLAAEGLPCGMCDPDALAAMMARLLQT